MNRLGDVIANLAKKAGLQHTDANLKDIVALTTPVPEEVENVLNSLMNNEEARAWAKGQPDIKSHYTAQAYNGMDKKIHEQAEKAGFSEEEMNQIKAERNTGSKHELYLTILQAKIDDAKKSGNSGKGDTKELEKKWQEQIDKANADAKKLREEYDNKLKEKDDHLSSFKKDTLMGMILKDQKWSDMYPENMRFKLGQMAIAEKMEKEGVTLALDEEKNELRLVRKDNPEMPYFDSSNKTPNFAEFAAKTLAENKFIAVSTPVQPNTPKPPVAPVITGQPNTPKRSNSALNLLQQSLKDQGLQQ